MANTGAPGAFPGSSRDGAAAICQRVCAALGDGSASILSRNSGTPDFSAASVRRRLAVKSSLFIRPQPSTITALNAALRKPSTAVRRSVVSSGAKPNRQQSDRPPSSIQPLA